MGGRGPPKPPQGRWLLPGALASVGAILQPRRAQRRRNGGSVYSLVGIGSGKLFGLDFPWGTLIINMTGSFLIDAFVAMFAAKWQLSQAMRIFLTVGICGGYTTFSTFSLDAFYRAERGALIPAAGYVVASVVLSIVALVLGVQLIRLVS